MIRKNFVWWGQRKKELHLVNWRTACLPKDQRVINSNVILVHSFVYAKV
jgi:hypothetical protein